MKFGLADWQRLSGFCGGAVDVSDLVGVMDSGEVGGGVRVPERGVLLGMGLLELSLLLLLLFLLPIPRSALMLRQQRVKALPPPWHRSPLA